jgi:hypothetical protein
MIVVSGGAVSLEAPSAKSRQQCVLALIGRKSSCLLLRTVVTSRTEQYRQLARDCRRLSKTLPLKDRQTMLDAAAEWDRLADQQERATDLDKKH